MKISAIVATAHNNIIGDGNKMPWYLPADLKFFKLKTMGHHLIMGRNTFESIGKALPGRTTIVLSRDKSYFISSCIMAHSIEEALTIAHKNGDDEAMIVGGGSVYRQALSYCDTVYRTEIDAEVNGSTTFPQLDMERWKEVHREPHKADEKNSYDYAFVKYVRKKADKPEHYP